MKRYRKAFTLVESLVVLLIFGIIMLAVYSFSSTEINTLNSYNDMHIQKMQSFNDLNRAVSGVTVDTVTKTVVKNYSDGVLYKYENADYKVYVYKPN